MEETFDLMLLKSCDLFKGLSDDELKTVYASMVTIKMQPNEVLMTQGEISDCMYFLLSGRLLVKLPDGTLIAQVGRGQTVGEMGVITDDPRSATVVAMRESILLKLDKAQFKKLWTEHPSLLFEVTKIITQRLRKSLKTRPKHSNDSNIAVLQANQETNYKLFMDQLSESFNHRFRYKIVRPSDFPLTFAIEQFHHQIREFEQNYDFIFYELSLHDEKWSDLCLEYADRILVIANASQKVNYDPAVLSLLTGTSVHPETKKILVLLHEEFTQPSNTFYWLQPIRFYRHYHVSWNQNEEFSRLLRLITGTAIGLVLSGGGTRSWAEVGALKYIFENKIPIDAFAGTSAGAMNAGSLAICRDYKDYLEIGKKIAKDVTFREYTIPYGSLLSSKSITKTLQEIFGDVKIEDLKKIAICVAADLIKCQEVDIQEGFLWHGIRSSLAIPGIYPPVYIPDKSQLLVDGAVVNNLPVDVLKNYFEGFGSIISIDISFISDQIPVYEYPLELTWVTILRKKIFSRIKKLVIPSIGSTLYKGLLLASAQKTKANTALSTIHMKPDLSDYGLLDNSKMYELIDIGYAEAEKALSNWRQDLNFSGPS